MMRHGRTTRHETTVSTPSFCSSKLPTALRRKSHHFWQVSPFHLPGAPTQPWTWQKLERVTRIALVSHRWQRRILLLNHTRKLKRGNPPANHRWRANLNLAMQHINVLFNYRGCARYALRSPQKLNLAPSAKDCSPARGLPMNKHQTEPRPFLVLNPQFDLTAFPLPVVFARLSAWLSFQSAPFGVIEPKM